jgi:hypothetical protein
MDEQAFAAAVERLKELNKVISGLDPTIRADAFKLLQGYVGADASEAIDDEDEAESAEVKKSSSGSKVDFDKLIETHESDKDADNAVLALAITYARHGKGPFAMTVIKGVANEFNLTVPARPDMFFKGHKRQEKEILRKQADGWKITPSGETWLKETYGVGRGKQPLSTSDDA